MSANPAICAKLGLPPGGLGGGPVASRPESASAAAKFRRALEKAADDVASLSVSVLGIAEEEIDADCISETATDGWVILGLSAGDDAGLIGLCCLDPFMRSALLEMQTMGGLLPARDQERGVTATDSTLCLPFALTLLAGLRSADFRGDRWSVPDARLRPVSDLRAAGLLLRQGVLRTWRVSLEVGGTEQQTEILLALRQSDRSPEARDQTRSDAAWKDAMKASLDAAPTRINAVLTRMPMMLSDVNTFEIGQLMQLSGVTLEGLRVESGCGAFIAKAKLGQVSGRRAIRLTDHVAVLEDLPEPRPVAVDANPDLPPQQVINPEGAEDN